jgi:hypothetical protein
MLPRQVGERQTDRDVALDVEHDDVLAGREAGLADLRADLRDAGRLHDHVDVQLSEQGRVGERRARVGCDSSGRRVRIGRRVRVP